jgi:hypothetical protein
MERTISLKIFTDFLFFRIVAEIWTEGRFGCIVSFSGFVLPRDCMRTICTKTIFGHSKFYDIANRGFSKLHKFSKNKINFTTFLA